MRLSEGIPFKTCANPQARDQNINQANLYENEMVLDGRNRAIVIAESLARVVAAIRTTSVRWRSDLPPKRRK